MKKLGRPKRLHKHDENGVLLIRCPKCDEYKSKIFFIRLKITHFKLRRIVKSVCIKAEKDESGIQQE